MILFLLWMKNFLCYFTLKNILLNILQNFAIYLLQNVADQRYARCNKLTCGIQAAEYGQLKIEKKSTPPFHMVKKLF